MLVDTGPLVAAIDRTDPAHLACARALLAHAGGCLTTWPVLTEAMYLLGKTGGLAAQEAIWSLLESGTVALHVGEDAGLGTLRALMRQYHDLPMDLADASLVALAEARGVRDVLTLDSDFSVYRLKGRHAFRLHPPAG